MDNPKTIIIVGGGFAGLQLIRKLKSTNYNIILIDRFNHHQFQPLLYQVASSQLEPSSISFPFRKIFQKYKNIHFRLAEVTSINQENNSLETNTGTFTYDYLVIASGCKTNFFGNNEIMNNAFVMKTTQNAIDIRNNILLSFEKLFSISEEEKEYYLNIVIVGAGPTGVELSGALAEMKRYILPKDYTDFDFTKLNIILIEGSKNTLNNMSETAKKASRKYLDKLGVTIKTELYVKNYDGKIATLSNNESIKSKNVIWAAGVTGNLIDGISSDFITKTNRYKVDRFNKIINTQNIFAIGDIAYMETPKYPNGHPQVANTAINQGKILARNFRKILLNKQLEKYEYNDLGSMATIGKHKAVVDFPFLQFKGNFAWYLWMFLHLMLILSVRNKLFIFLNWAWSYFTADSSLRLILGNKNSKN